MSTRFERRRAEREQLLLWFRSTWRINYLLLTVYGLARRGWTHRKTHSLA